MFERARVHVCSCCCSAKQRLNEYNAHLEALSTQSGLYARQLHNISSSWVPTIQSNRNSVTLVPPVGLFFCVVTAYRKTKVIGSN